jgi:predicted regulator of Ras-like GTPase activity (Roadblock/LC7/MglB family)
MAILSGNLGEVDVPGILELGRQMPGYLFVDITTPTKEYVIVMNNGEVIHASNEQGTGPGILFEAFGVQVGSFTIEKGDTPPQESTIDIPWNTLLLQGLQHLDETKDHLFNKSEKTIMSTKEKLEEVLREMAAELEPGLFGIGVAGSDGMGIAYNKVNGETAENLSAQMALIVQVSRRSAQRLENSQVEDVQVTSDRTYLIGRFLGDNEHFVFVNVARDSVLGNVRLIMRNYADRLLKAVPK